MVSIEELEAKIKELESRIITLGEVIKNLSNKDHVHAYISSVGGYL